MSSVTSTTRAIGKFPKLEQEQILTKHLCWIKTTVETMFEKCEDIGGERYLVLNKTNRDAERGVQSVVCIYDDDHLHLSCRYQSTSIM